MPTAPRHHARSRGLIAALASIALCGLSACGASPRGGGLSTPSIRNGATVATDDLGPERLGTVGLQGVTRDGTYTCSAAILDSNLIVTAGHCVEAGAKLYVFFGNDMRAAASADDYIAVVATRVHPDYHPHADGSGLVPHDIAVLKLATTVPAPYAPTPRLDAAVRLADGQSVRLAGYGITESGSGLKVLRYVDTTYAGADADGRLEINDDRRRGACSGDSGGPLFVQQDDAWFLGGVLSGGPIPCRGVNIYTPVAAHQAFLEATSVELNRR